MIDAAPFQEAVDRMSSKTPIAVALSSAEWRATPQELRDRGFFVSAFAQANALQLMQDKIGESLKMGREEVANGTRIVDRNSFIQSTRRALNESGYLPPEGKEGTIQDHYTTGRLGLIFDINTRMAQEYGQWKVGQDPDILDAFPAQELYREEARIHERAWRKRWKDHGGGIYGGRMIARKNDPIWSAISAFGSPYPPFDYNSGMGVRDVSRDVAEQLGVISRNEIITPDKKGFNDTLSLSCTNLTQPLVIKLQAQFGDQVVIKNGQAQWKANLIKDFVGHALKNPSWKDKISLGVATPVTVAKAKEFEDLADFELLLTADETRHAILLHGTDNEALRGQVKLTPEDFVAVADLWRSPDKVLSGDPKIPDSLVFQKDLGGMMTMVTWRMGRKKKVIYLHSLWKKKSEGGAA